MSIRSSHSHDHVRHKRQRTASQNSIDRGSAKKARSGPQPQSKSTKDDLSDTISPHQSTTRRAATDIGHNTKQDWADFLRTSERSPRLPDIPLPSENTPQRLPLTEESLRLLDNSCLYSGSKNSDMSPSNKSSKLSKSSKPSPSEKAININAYDPEYLKALKRRGVSFARPHYDERPPGLDKWWKELSTPRKSPAPDQAIIEQIQETINEAPNELAIVARILPKVIPVDTFTGGSTARSAPDMLWKSALNPELTPGLTAPKPDLTIGWESDVFESFPKAMASLDTFAYPVISAQHIAWPFFTVEAKGEKGSRRVCRLQNLHNGAIMLSNLYALKQKCKREETFFDKVHVIGVELDEGHVSLSCYWATRPGPGQVKYFGKTLETWSLLASDGQPYRAARSCIHNAIDWVQSEMQEWIFSDLQAVEDSLISFPLEQIEVPICRSARRRIENGRVSKASTTISQGTEKTSLPDPQ